MHWRYFISLVLIFGTSLWFPSALYAQEKTSLQNISGHWKGIITQEEGGYRAEYKFELFIRIRDHKISGRSYVFVEDLNAEMEITGTIRPNSEIYLQDIKIIGHKERPGMEWCLRQLFLFYKIENEKIILEGRWQGKTSFSTCTPGKVKLTKVDPRA
ncbi:MAG: hypothetical protein AB8G15_01805 [Saprospiraceae bacterium]